MNASARTAIKRKKLSAPMRWLFDNNMIKQGYLLDYGCGRGDDIRIMKEEFSDIYSFGWDLYHTHNEYWFCDNFQNQWWRTVVCNYVLNVIPSGERAMVIQDLLSLDAGDIYVTVRRDLKADYKTRLGTEQYLVHLDYPIVKETSWYCIYKIR